MADYSRQARKSSGFGPERGLFNVVSVVVLVLVVVAVAIAAILLAKTMAAAQSINKKAAVIATTGRGINTATDSVVQLSRTNRTASSILTSAKPLEAALAKIVNSGKVIDGLAKSINSHAVTINGTAGAINGTAGAINGSAGKINSTAGAIDSNAKTINGTAGAINQTAKGINTSAASILTIATRVDTDAHNINRNLDGTIGLANAIKGDTDNIVAQAIGARHTAACIAGKLLAGTGGDC